MPVLARGIPPWRGAGHVVGCIVIKRLPIGQEVDMRGDLIPIKVSKDKHDPNSIDRVYNWECPQCGWVCGTGHEEVGATASCGRCSTDYRCVEAPLPEPRDDREDNWVVDAHPGSRWILLLERDWRLSDGTA